LKERLKKICIISLFVSFFIWMLVAGVGFEPTTSGL
jgi:hypothetical protein